MKETAWVKGLLPQLNALIQKQDPSLCVESGKHLVYAHEIRRYASNGTAEAESTAYQTDMLVLEKDASGAWKPRVVIECKLGQVTTHDAITYTQKAVTHRHVHPCLRYGLLIGKWGGSSLPGRAYRHGSAFDFMMAWEGTDPTTQEMSRFTAILLSDVEASRTLERLLFDTRSKKRARFTWVHHPLNAG